MPAWIGGINQRCYVSSKEGELGRTKCEEKGKKWARKGVKVKSLLFVLSLSARVERRRKRDPWSALRFGPAVPRKLVRTKIRCSSTPRALRSNYPLGIRSPLRRCFRISDFARIAEYIGLAILSPNLQVHPNETAREETCESRTTSLLYCSNHIRNTLLACVLKTNQFKHPRFTFPHPIKYYVCIQFITRS